MADEKVVLITGGGIGIGAATAAAFGLADYKVIVTDILADEGKEVVDKIIRNGGRAQYHHMDVSDSENVQAVVEDVEKRNGALDCVVANAGIAHRVALGDLSDEEWDRTHEIDLKGAMRVCRAAAARMRAVGSGSMVLISSIMGVAYGWDQHVAYSAAKAGTVGLVRALAVELARDGIRVNGVAPGYIRTAQALSDKHSLGTTGLEKAREYIPMGRVGEADDIADVIKFLASDEARYMTGQVVVVDGGLLVGRY
jgi:3-oxoacyl-[acyl-carrier protein] reductase